MDRIFDIAVSVSTPLMLGGFLAAAFFFIAKQILAKNIFPKLSQALSSEIIRLIIERLFVLSLAAMILGFLGFILPRPNASPTGQANQARAIAVLSVQFEEIQKVSELLSGKTELELRNDFGFNEMFQQNVDWLFNRYRHTAFDEEFDINSVLRVGSTLKILEGGAGTVEYETGKFTPEISDRMIRHLLLSEQFQEMSSVLRKFGDSTFLSEETRKLIKEYIDLAEENTIVLGNVLDEAARELPERYSKAEDAMSTMWINNRWVRRFNELTPKAREIKENLRVYVRQG